MGSTTLDAAQPVQSARADIASAAEDFARSVHTWLDDARLRSVYSERALTDAATSIEVAIAHFRELDLVAGSVARDAAATGEVNPQQVEQVGVMAETIEAFSTRLRALLDPQQVSPPEAEQRLRTAIDAARLGGGLPALVASL